MPSRRENRNHVLQDAVILTTKRHDDGVRGYFRELASAHPERFARLLRRALVLEIKSPTPDPEWEQAYRMEQYHRQREEQIETMRGRGLSEEQIVEVYKIQASIFKKIPPRKTAPQLPEEIVAAATQVGDNGRGRNGLTGYLHRLQNKYPDAFAGLLACLLALEPDAPFEQSSNVISPEERERQADLCLEEFTETLRQKGWLDAFRGYSGAELEADLATDKS